MWQYTLLGVVKAPISAGREQWVWGRASAVADDACPTPPEGSHMASVKGVLWQAAWKPEEKPRGVAPRREPPLPEVACAPLQLIGGFFRIKGKSLAEGKSAKLWSGLGSRPAIQEPHD
jgi:hypothetical protein